MERRHKHEEHENDERWLITYADLITLLMVFFVVMWSISRADAAKFAAVAQSMSVAFGTPKGSVIPMPATGTSRSPKQAPKDASKSKAAGATQTSSASSSGSSGQQSKLQSVAKELEKMIREAGLQEMINLDGSADGRKLTIRLRDSILFDRGGATLTPQAQALIERLGGVLKDIGMVVNVVGHTDDIPIRSGIYGSNYELSTARSTAVVLDLINRVGYPPQMISPSGWGEYRPIAPNDSLENRARNRRVEFVITDEGPLDIATPTKPAEERATTAEATESSPEPETFAAVQPAPEHH